jgi:glycosyltransferase involved in cell wall biosynthesis
MTDPTKNPLVSIIVRTKDRPKLLERALKSIAAQTYRPVEVVLVNDGGCDLDAGVLTGILGDVSLDYIRLEKNMGRANAGNVGIEQANGAYVGFLDDDDEFYPEHLSVLVGYLEQSDLKVSYSDSMMVHKEYNPETHEIVDRKKELVFSEEFDYGRLVFENYIPFMCVLFNGEVIKNSGGFDASFELYEDWDLLLRIGEKFPFYHVKRITADYNQWSAALQIAQNNADSDFLRQAYLKVLSKHFVKVTPSRIQGYMSAYVHLRHLLKEAQKELNFYRDRSGDRYPQVRHLEEKLYEKEARIANLEKALGDREARLLDLQGRLGQRDIQVEDLTTGLHDRDSLITSLRVDVEEKDRLIQAITSTLGWRVLDKYRRVRNRVLAPLSVGSRLHFIAKGLRVIRNEGSASLVQKINRKYLFRKPSVDLANRIEILPVPVLPGDKPIDAKVSIVIPTRNAGDEFEYTLRRIVQQEGVGGIELIVVDSGSQDRTVEISKIYTKKIFQITPEEFHHAGTRNFGAEKAEGDFLVFTVQDAVPVGNCWLHNLLYPICQGQASAVSARQVPRSDADLFASWSYWNHNIGFLGHDRDLIYDKSRVRNFDEVDVRTKRIMASLDNVSLGIGKTIFDAYRFHSDYAEDLELGLKLLNDGHALMFQSSNAVIHSHNRPAIYYLMRSYTDTVSLARILKFDRKNMSARAVTEATTYLYCALKKSFHTLPLEKLAKEPGELINSLLNDLAGRISVFDSSWLSLKGDARLDNYFNNILPQNRGNLISDMFSILAGNLRSFSEFIKRYGSLEDRKEDFVAGVYKIFCNVAGDFLAANTCERIDFMEREFS